MIDRNVFVWSSKQVRRQYRRLLQINKELDCLFNTKFPFVKPGPRQNWSLTPQQFEARRAILAIPCLPYDLLRVEEQFKQVYMRHIGIIAFFKITNLHKKSTSN